MPTVRIMSRFPRHAITPDGEIYGPRGKMTPHPLNPARYGRPKNTNYLAVNIQGKPRKVHQLVCRAYHGDPEPGQVVRHLNGNSMDNRAVNLKWGTRSENAIDRQSHSTTQCGEASVTAKLTWEQVRQIRSEYASGGSTHRSLAARYGVTKSAITSIVASKTWKDTPA